MENLLDVSKGFLFLFFKTCSVKSILLLHIRSELLRLLNFISGVHQLVRVEGNYSRNCRNIKFINQILELICISPNEFNFLVKLCKLVAHGFYLLTWLMPVSKEDKNESIFFALALSFLEIFSR